MFEHFFFFFKTKWNHIIKTCRVKVWQPGSVVVCAMCKQEITGSSCQMGLICCGIVLLGKALDPVVRCLDQGETGYPVLDRDSWCGWLVSSTILGNRSCMPPRELKLFSEWRGPVNLGGVLCKVGRTALDWIPGYKRLPLLSKYCITYFQYIHLATLNTHTWPHWVHTPGHTELLHV